MIKKIINKLNNPKFYMCGLLLILPIISQAQTIDDAFGVNLHLRNRYYEADWDAALAKAQTAGVQWAREEFSWDAIEPADNEYNWTQYDSVINKYQASNIKVMGLLTYSTQWASTNSGSSDYEFYQPNSEAWQDYVYNVALHYKGQVGAWEIWNEPNTTSFWKNNQEDYIALFTAAAKKINEADPEAYIVLGGLSGADTNFLDLVYNNIESKDLFDVVAIHPYRLVGSDFNYLPEKQADGLNMMVTDLNNISSVMKKYNDTEKPIWLTEFGYTTYTGGVSEYDQASLLMRAYAMATSMPQVKKVFWYTFRDDAVNTEYLESSFGLVNNSLVDKLSLTAFTFLKEKLQDKDYQKNYLANKNVLDNFNEKSGWQFVAAENTNGKITEDHHNVMKVYYQFEGKEVNSFLPIYRKIKMPEKTRGISFSAKGSNDTTNLRVRIQDRKRETFQYNLGYLSSDYTTYHLLLKNFSQSWNGDGELDYPISFDSFVLDDNPDGSKASGNVYFNNLESSIDGKVYIYEYSKDNEKNYLIWTVGSAREYALTLDDAKKVRVYTLQEGTELIEENKNHKFKIHISSQPKWVHVVE